MLLEKFFTIDLDYIFFAPATAGAKKGRGGHNKETILMTIKTFKKLCLKADTKKAEQIHEYYINLEEILQEVINEESSELKLQLETQTNKMQFEKNYLEKKQSWSNSLIIHNVFIMVLLIIKALIMKLLLSSAIPIFYLNVLNNIKKHIPILD